MLTLETSSSNLTATGECFGCAVTVLMAILTCGKPLLEAGLDLMVAPFAEAGGSASTTH